MSKNIELFDCEALRARISKRQCQINQELADKRSNKQEREWGNQFTAVGLLHVCLKCEQPEKAGRAEQELVPKLWRTMTGRHKKTGKNDLEKINMIEKDRDMAGPEEPMQEYQKDEGQTPPLQAVNGQAEAPPARMCPNHPDRPVFQPKDGRRMKYCHDCLKEIWQKSQQMAAAARRKNSAAKTTTAAAILSIDFTGREELLRSIESLAAAEERTPAGQVMFWLRQHVAREGAP